MPELPEVETIVRELRSNIVDKRLREVRIYHPGVLKNNPSDFSHSLVGQSIRGVSRRGKNIVIELSDHLYLLIHLGMTGQLVYLDSESPLQVHTHVVFCLSPGNHQLRYRDQRRFGHLHLNDLRDPERLPQLSRLGPDPLEIDLEEFIRIIVSRKRRIKTLLLDQGVLAGLGNIYTDESLHRAKVHPERLAFTLSPQELRRLHQSVQEVLQEAIAYGGSSVDDYLRVDAQPGSYQQLHRVYRREGNPCYRCGETIIRKKVSGRGTYFCPHCQPFNP